MDAELRGKRIVILATDGFEQSELTEPFRGVALHKGKPEPLALRRTRGKSSRS